MAQLSYLLGDRVLRTEAGSVRSTDIALVTIKKTPLLSASTLLVFGSTPLREDWTSPKQSAPLPRFSSFWNMRYELCGRQTDMILDEV